MTNKKATPQQGVPIREGLFKLPSEPGAKAYLIGSRCKKCAQIDFPQRAVCPKCFNEDLDKIPLSTKGTLYTYTIIGYAPPGLRAPYAIGYIDLPEGVRVFSILAARNDERLEVGMDVELVIEKFTEDKQGNTILTYKFRPVR